MKPESYYVENVQRAADGCIHALTMAQEFPSAAGEFLDIASDWSDSAFFWVNQYEWNKHDTADGWRNAA